MWKAFAITVAAAHLASGAVVIDRIAVIVGKRVVKQSDIDRDLRVTDFLNREPLSESADAKRKAADRLVDQQVIRNEIATGDYPRASGAEADSMLSQIVRDRFGGSEARLRAALTAYGLTEDELREQLVWQLTVLKFIDERFRPGVLVTDEEARAYYNQHQQLRRTSYEAAAPAIRKTLEGEQVNKEFESWLDEERKRQNIEFKQEAFR